MNKGYPYITVVSIISLLACWFMCTTILIFRDLRRKTEMKFVFFLEMFYGIQCFVTIFPGFISEEYCTFQGFMIRFTGLCGVLWTGYISFSFYWVDVLKKRLENLLFLIPLGAIILFSLFTCIFSYYYPENTYKGGITWCWNESKDHVIDNAYKYALYYSIVWLVMIIQIFIFTRIWILYKKYGASSDKMKLLKYYPMALFCCFIPMSIFRILQSVMDPKDIPLAYPIFSACVLRLLGLINFIIYGFDKEVRNIIIGRYEMKPIPIV